ncbi:hypothetical protein [Cryobacterium sp. Y11]|uniref:hypothetical protein n=1 Tax=Cryobacterium sp. Y11 TaxID=2045016 RepID=UPI000CE504AF|nr:hypothetical protein [Cryobacterium sp. Y11]
MNNVTDEWGRLDAQPTAGNRAGLYMQGGELRRNGIDTSTLGFLDLGAAIRAGTRHVEIPVLENLALSLVTPGEVQLIRAKPNAFRRDHPVAAAGYFSDPHPQEWLDALSLYDQALLVLGGRPGQYGTLGDWMLTWHIGLVPVAYRMDFDGFSMHPRTITGDLTGA